MQCTPFWVAEKSYTKTNFDITDLKESYVYKKIKPVEFLINYCNLLKSKMSPNVAETYN